MIKLQAMLDKVKSLANIKADIKAIESNLQSWLKTIKINAKIDGNNAKETARETGNQIAQNIADGIRQSGGKVDSETQKLVDRAKELTSSLNRDTSVQQSQENAAKEAKKQIQEMGKTALSWTDKLKDLWSRFGVEKIVQGSMAGLYKQLCKIPKAIYEIDAAMTRLYKVTDETDKKYTQFFDSISDSAYKLGRSVSSLIDQTTNWAKSGFSLDDAKQLANISSIYANIGGIDDSTAVRDMLAAMEAFNIQTSNAITIVDKLTKLESEYAASSAALGEGLSRSASAMAASGTDMNKTLAMLAGGTEITQNAPEFGDFLKVSSMRLRGMKDELAALGEEADSTAGSINKIQSQILSLTGGQVNILDNAGNARAYYDVMKDISKIYNSLSDANKTNLTELLFGKQGGSKGTALIQAFQSGQIQNALDTTLYADGSAMKEQERWLESLEAKTRQFEAAFQSLSSSILDSKLLKWFIDFGTGSVRALDAVTSTIGSLGTIGVGIAGILGKGRSNTILPCMAAMPCSKP